MAVFQQRSDQPDGTTLAAPDNFVHYYDQHPTEEDLMGESVAQSELIFYLLQVLKWHYRDAGWLVVTNLNIYRTREEFAYPLAPDVAVFKGVVWAAGQPTLRSWRLYEENRPAPQVVFEICSEGTWKSDLQAKPAKYAALGVREYFLYDPNEPPCFPRAWGRLRGWQVAAQNVVELDQDAQGRIWSAELDSYLMADGAFLRLYDADGRQRLTAAEAERAAKEAEQAAKERERAAKEAAWAKLRELGIEPPDV